MCVSTLDVGRNGQISLENIKAFLQTTLLHPDPVVIEDSEDEEDAEPATHVGSSTVEI